MYCMLKINRHDILPVCTWIRCFGMQGFAEQILAIDLTNKYVPPDRRDGMRSERA